MREGNEIVEGIIEFTKGVWERKQELVENNQDMLDIGVSISELSSSFFPVGKNVVKGIQSLVQTSSRIRLRHFLKGFATNAEESTVTEEQVEKMRKYLKNENNVIYISDLIAAGVQSQSIDCSEMMGYYAGLLLKESQKINYKDMIVLNALKTMNKQDLENFLLLYVAFERSTNTIRTIEKVDELQHFEASIFEIENTIEKMKRVLVFGYDEGGIGGVGNAWGAFLFNENTDYLFNVLKKSGAVNG